MMVRPHPIAHIKQPDFEFRYTPDSYGCPAFDGVGKEKPLKEVVRMVFEFRHF